MTPTQKARSRTRRQRGVAEPSRDAVAPDVRERAPTAPAENPRADAESDELAGPRIRTMRELRALGSGQVDLLLFRVGSELFALDLVAIEEAVELPPVRTVPDAATAMLGVTDLRGRLVAVFSPAQTLRCVPDAKIPVLLVMRLGDRRVGLAVDDVEDVLVLEASDLRTPSLRHGNDELVHGVVRRAGALVTVLDAPALLAACVSESNETRVRVGELA
ncbi:MAG: chemotaxis protein CheW [Gemmatimonadota bacterium]|nr:chemotaxis protein CheW [Gemmatimonadota bacterium]